MGFCWHLSYFLCRMVHPSKLYIHNLTPKPHPRNECQDFGSLLLSRCHIQKYHALPVQIGGLYSLEGRHTRRFLLWVVIEYEGNYSSTNMALFMMHNTKSCGNWITTWEFDPLVVYWVEPRHNAVVSEVVARTTSLPPSSSLMPTMRSQFMKKLHDSNSKGVLVLGFNWRRDREPMVSSIHTSPRDIGA